MKKVIFSLLAVALIFSSCGDNAVEVNGVVIHEVRKVNDVLETISQNITANEFDLAKANVDSLKVQTTASQEIINQLKNKKAVAYKQSAIDYIAFIEVQGPEVFNKAIGMFQAANEREQADIASGKQPATKLNFGPDFDAARKVLSDFRIELKKVQAVLFEKQGKFAKANGIAE